MFSGVSLSGTSSLLVQLGAGSVTSSGYVSTSISANNANLTTGANSTSGFVLQSNSAAYVISGQMVITTLGSNIWSNSHACTQATTNICTGGGTVTLGGTHLTAVRITTVGGTDTFDAGRSKHHV
jgi:hypothetical protein